jgi:putative transcriptional regulator
MSSKYRSRIAEEVHEMARGLHSAGAIDNVEMQEFDLRCLAPAPKYTSEMVRDLRNRLNITQVALASVLNTSPSTVQKWETGAKNPGGPSCKLLYLLDQKGIEALQC